jgi:hypothetical protein
MSEPPRPPTDEELATERSNRLLNDRTITYEQRIHFLVKLFFCALCVGVVWGGIQLVTEWRSWLDGALGIALIGGGAVGFWRTTGW